MFSLTSLLCIIQACTCNLCQGLWWIRPLFKWQTIYCMWSPWTRNWLLTLIWAYTVEPHLTAAINVIADTSFGPECIYICLCKIKTSEVWKLLYSIKWTGFPVSSVPEVYKIHKSGRSSTAFIKLCTTFGGFKGQAIYKCIRSLC